VTHAELAAIRERYQRTGTPKPLWQEVCIDIAALLAEVERLSAPPPAQPPRDEIDRPWTREYERNVWHYDGKDGMMLCGIIIAGSPLVMANEFAFAVRKCPTCRRGAP